MEPLRRRAPERGEKQNRTTSPPRNDPLSRKVWGMGQQQTAIQLERQGTVALVQLAGERLHLLSMTRLQALDEALMALMADQSIRAVVLHGAGGLFSAGADLETMARFDAQAATAFIEALHGTCQRILLAPKPIIATKALIAYSMQLFAWMSSALT